MIVNPERSITYIICSVIILILRPSRKFKSIKGTAYCSKRPRSRTNRTIFFKVRVYLDDVDLNANFRTYTSIVVRN